MEQVPGKISFPEAEEGIQKLWKETDAFKTSLKKSENKPEYTFYDGPPFATGLPHYGHILAGTIKDIVTRYATQTGHHVVRRFGWDCHGIPIEFEIDKMYGVKTKDDVLKMGIPVYNEACRGIVLKYSNDWEKIVTRLGRWIDFKNDYKTMDVTFMESVWWVFKEIFDKGYVYKGFKVMPYSTGCTTPLSNFEAKGQDNYKDVDDPAIVVSFPLDGDTASLVAWTTTPWTLPSNLALCVHPEFDYVRVESNATKKQYIIAEKRTSELFKDPKDFKVLGKMKGKELKDKKYTPLFPYFLSQQEKGAFRVLNDTFVTEDSGTGVVHCAPAFGEDDFRVCTESGIVGKGGQGLVCPVDGSGLFTADVTDFAGRYVKEADKDIIKKLKEMGRLEKNASINHSYPFCWRSDTPLIYKAVPSWFIAVERIQEQLLENNKKSYWVPGYVQEKRFHNWLADSRDWAISRNRYWGTPIPIWISEDGEEVVVVGSIQELKDLTGATEVTDLHRHKIDHLTIPSKKGKGTLKRIDEVFDCWFESGSMPYAQQHYPFENKERLEKGFPADFIAEGIDQTRGWFYTLLVISTILKGQAPFKNLIVNGLVLAADGQKMSKRKKNYPDPMRIVDEFGADALRLYLINSPVVRGENLRFNEKGVKDILKDVFIPWFNAYRFCTEATRKFDKTHSSPFVPSVALALQSDNIMDKWILAAVNGLVEFVRKEMAAYRLYTVLPQLIKFIDQLTNWYVRLNRRRLKGSGGEKDCRIAIATLYEVIFTVIRMMSPFTPFLTEYFYQNLRKILPADQAEESIHYVAFPTPIPEAINPRIEESVSRMQAVIQLGRTARERKNLPLKFPLNKITVVHKDEQYRKDVESLKSFIVEELNVRDVATSADDTQVTYIAKPDFKALGTKLRKDLPKVQAAIKALTHVQLQELQAAGSAVIEGHTITAEELQVTKEYKGDVTKNEAAWDENVLIILDIVQDEAMRQEGVAREVMNRVQKLRKKAGIHPTDPIEVFYKVDQASEVAKVIHKMGDFITQTTNVGLAPLEHMPSSAVQIISEESSVVGVKLFLTIRRLSFGVSVPSLKAKFNDDAFVNDLQTLLQTRDYSALLKQLSTSNNNGIKFRLNDKEVELHLGKDLFKNVTEMLKVQK